MYLQKLSKLSLNVLYIAGFAPLQITLEATAGGRVPRPPAVRLEPTPLLDFALAP